MIDTNALIIEYSHHPANKYIMENPTIRYREHNRVCADVVELFLRIEEDRVVDAAFDGYMSIVATACTAIVAESIIMLGIEEILTLDESYIHALIGTDISPRRRNASLIGLLAIKNALHTHLGHTEREDFSDIMVG